MIVSCNLAAGHLPGHCLKRKNITLKNHSANTVYSIHPIMNSFWIWEKYICDIRILIIKCSRNHIFFCKSMKMKKSVMYFPDPPCCTTTRVGIENSYIVLVMHIFHSSKVKDYQRILSAKQNEKKTSTKIQRLPKKFYL